MNGDFSTIDSGNCVSGGKGRTVDRSCLPNNAIFPGNQIPVSRFNPQALHFVNQYIPRSADPCGRITYGIPTTGDEEQVIGRIDWVQNSKHSLYGRYFIANYRNPAVYDGQNLLTTTAAGNLERAQTLTIGDTYIFSRTIVNAFHATVTRSRDNRGVASNIINPADLGINIFSPIPNFVQICQQLLQHRLRDVRSGPFQRQFLSICRRYRHHPRPAPDGFRRELIRDQMNVNND